MRRVPAPCGQFLDTLAAEFGGPAQNIIAADRTGSIAIRSTGNYPAPPRRRRRAYDPRRLDERERLAGLLARLAVPAGVRPGAGVSGLGQPAAHRPARSARVSRLRGGLRSVARAPHQSPAARRLRGDRRRHAALSRPTPEASAPNCSCHSSFRRRHTRGCRARTRSGSTRRGRGSRGGTAATRARTSASLLFETALRQLAARTWDELAPDGGRRAATPSTEVLLELLHDSASVWWDDRRTPDRVERRDDIVAASLEAAYDSLVQRFGPPGPALALGSRATGARESSARAYRGFRCATFPCRAVPAR